MKIAERIAMAQRLEETYRAERLGLIQAQAGTPLSPSHFLTDHEQEGFSRGYVEGKAILDVGDRA